MKRAKLITEHKWTVDGFKALGPADQAAREALRVLTQAAQEALAPLGGRIDHNAPPSFLGPTAVGDEATGADLIVFAVEWTVLVPRAFDSEAEAVRDAWKWV